MSCESSISMQRVHSTEMPCSALVFPLTPSAVSAQRGELIESNVPKKAQQAQQQCNERKKCAPSKAQCLGPRGPRGPHGPRGPREPMFQTLHRLHSLLQQLSSQRRRFLVEQFSQEQRLALERYILSDRDRVKRGSRLEPASNQLGRKWSRGGVHCRVHGGRRLYRAHATVGPFSVASRYDAKLATAERFRDVLCAMSKRVAVARSIEEVEQFFREALVEEPRKWGLNGREDMRLCFTASVSAKHWVGRSLATPRFALTELEDGLRAWHKLRQARKSFLLSPLSNVFNTSFLTQQELDTAWCSLSQAYVEVWASSGRRGAAAKLHALRSQHVHLHKRRSKKARHLSVEERILRLLRHWQPGLRGEKRCMPRVPHVPRKKSSK